MVIIIVVFTQLNSKNYEKECFDKTPNMLTQ